jgi:chromosome segregation ATPase
MEVILPNHVTGAEREKQKGTGQVDFSSAQRMAQLRQKVKKLSAQQIQLSEQREEVLHGRQLFVQNAARVREQLHKGVSAATSFMDSLREHYHKLDAPPGYLINAYNTLDEEKDRLGSLEAEYLQTENDLGALEWKFMELENDLYQYDLQQLFGEETKHINVESQEPKHTAMKAQDLIPVSRAIQYYVTSTEYSRLMDQYNVLRQKIAGKLTDEPNLSIDKAGLLEHAKSGEQSFSDLLTQIASCEVRLKSLKRQLAPEEDTPGVRLRCLSEPACQIEKLYDDSDILCRVQSEGTITDLMGGSSTAHRVRDWLLDC